MTQIRQDVLEMPLDHTSYLDDRFEAAPTYPPKPLPEEPTGRAFVAVGPKPGEQLFRCPGSGDFQAALPQHGKTGGLLRAEVLGIEQPELARSAQSGIALRQQFLVLLAANFVDSLIQMAGDVKLIVNDLCVRRSLRRRLDRKSTRLNSSHV